MVQGLRGGDVHIARGTDPERIVLRYTPDPMTVAGVDGDKSLQLFAGDLKVDVGTLEKVRDAEVSTRVGDVDVPAIGQLRGWLGHTWKYQGNGPYGLYAHTSFGEASLLAK